ncbi:MauE/DoxX family redox-associated membrane protein [Hymenobacter metallicola]|uniref:DoxX family membrane protein n=1 Tax=Hymenobacter metallicola TaxID=2563114 RepID=A0A4Z0QAA2_9BACT|nr:MauE/DoxX family redox-associated membrane protein [Hymenobacter metallicola]TGE26634.1 DoxX family membrane protein [Hymenobacter metallicola]
MKYSRPVVLTAGIIGVFFLVSGVGKALDQAQFADTIVAYGLPKLRFAAPLLTTVELALGVGLLLRIHVRLLAAAALALLVMFTLFFAYGYLGHGVTDCGCFGAFTALQMPPWLAFGRNGLLLLLAAGLYRAAPEPASPPARWQLLVVSGVTLGSFLAVGSRYTPQVFLAPGQAVRATALAPYCSPHQATYLVFIFRPTCPHCWAATPTLLNYQKTGLVSKIVALSPRGPAEEQQKYMRHFAPSFAIHTVPDAEMRQLTNQVPTVVVVKQDTIRAVLNSAEPLDDALSKALRLREVAVGTPR